MDWTDPSFACDYVYYMRQIEIKVVRVGKLRGIRILVHPRGLVESKLSWEETAREMANSGEDWSDWDVVSVDGMDATPWSSAFGSGE